MPFIDQPQSDIIVFAKINFHIYNIIVKKWKHGIGPNDIITFNGELWFILTILIGLVNINEFSHKEEILIL